MKINIITFFWSNNLGALIQANSLKSFIQKKSNQTVSFNSYSPKNLIIRERMSQINRKNFKVLHKVFFKKLKNFYWKKKIMKCDYPNQKNLIYGDDLYVYGSDEIWNYQNPFFGLDKFFFGKDNEKKKITYAVSTGNLDYKKDQTVENLKTYVKNFDEISVRDYESRKFVEYCSGKKPVIVMDPCFLTNIEENTKINDSLKSEIQGFILIYGDYFNSNQIQDIKKISKNNNWKIISVGFYNDWADMNIISVNPLDLICFFINSKLVFTSMFHGVMLSYKYKKQFWISEDPYRIKKLSFFIDYLNLKNRYLENINNQQIDYKKDENKFLEWIDLSKDFLEKHIIV